MSDALPTEPDHVSANDKPHGDDNRKDGTLKMPPLYFLTKWPVTIPIMGAFVAIYFIYTDVAAFKEAVVAIASVRWGTGLWVVISVLLVLINILTIAFARYIIKGKDASIADLRQLNAALRDPGAQK